MDDQSEWQKALAPLREAPPPPAALEGRVLSALAARRGGGGTRKRLALLFAALILLAVGGVAGRWMAPRFEPPPGPRFLLLLYEGGGFDRRGASHESMVAEYRAWGESLARAGKLVDGAELGPEGRVLGGGGESTIAPAGVVAGYFIIQARDTGEAAAIASGCPHLKYGGSVAIRPLGTS